MRIAILGSGNVGTGLGRGWAARGHSITFGVRDLSSPKAQAAVAAVPGATLADPVVAAQHADLVVLAVPFGACEALAEQIREVATGKVVVDTTNAVDWADGPYPALEGTTVAAVVAAALPESRVVKAFNTIGAEHSVNPVLGGQTTVMPVCGDDPEAVEMVLGLARELGFDAVNAGPLRNARLLEDMAVLWMYLATRGGLGRNFGFALARG